MLRIPGKIILFSCCALLLCACQPNAAISKETPAPLTTTAPAPSAQTQATPNPKNDAAQPPVVAQVFIEESNVYVEGQVLTHRAFLDREQNDRIMVELWEFCEAAGITAQSLENTVTLQSSATNTTVIIDDINLSEPMVRVDGQALPLEGQFVKKSGALYIPLDQLTRWFQMDWIQNEVGDILVAHPQAPEYIEPFTAQNAPQRTAAIRP